MQQRVIIGDEMGLGKTLQALAAMCHLAADGARHFLVVCPASVIVNWTREIQRHTKLDAHRLQRARPGAESPDMGRSRRRGGDYVRGEDSAKLRRLVEIADEATSDGRKVVVFSFFRDVLDTVAAALGAKAVGPLTEPQWTPASEEQAIARCHRMGQVRRVDVHRPLTENSVDQRMLEILRVKATEFDEYARRSDLKDISPDAVDISDLAAAKATATQAEQERRIVEIERKRLRMEEGEVR